MTFTGLPYANNYERRIYEAKAKIKDTPPEKIVHHEIYPRIGTSDRQRRYLAAHGIKHVRADGEYR